MNDFNAWCWPEGGRQLQRSFHIGESRDRTFTTDLQKALVIGPRRPAQENDVVVDGGFVAGRKGFDVHRGKRSRAVRSRGSSSIPRRPKVWTHVAHLSHTVEAQAHEAVEPLERSQVMRSPGTQTQTTGDAGTWSFWFRVQR